MEPTDPEIPAIDETATEAQEPSEPRAGRVTELRVVIETEDWDTAVRFYRDALGLDDRHGYANDDAAQLVLAIDHASIELVHPRLSDVDHEESIPEATELSDASAPRVRLSFRSDDARSTLARLEEAGAQRVIDPTLVPTDSLSARIVGPDGMPITVFQSLSGPDFSEPPPTAD